MRNNITKLALLFGVVATMGFGAMNTAVADTSERTGGMGHLELVLAGSDGTIKQYVQTDNLITHQGLDCLVDVLFGSSGTGNCGATTTFNAIGIGTDTNSTITSTQLGDELEPGCVGFTDLSPTAGGETTPQTITIDVVFGGSTSGTSDITDVACEDAITEAGLFNAGSVNIPSLGDMFAYQTFSAITIGASDTLTVTWTIDFS